MGYCRQRRRRAGRGRRGRIPADRVTANLTRRICPQESQAPRNALTQRHTDLKNECYELVKARGATLHVRRFHAAGRLRQQHRQSAGERLDVVGVLGQVLVQRGARHPEQAVHLLLTGHEGILRLGQIQRGGVVRGERSGEQHQFGDAWVGRDWAVRNPDVTGTVLDQDNALTRGITEFGDLTAATPPEDRAVSESMAGQTPSIGLEEFDRGWLEAIEQTPSALAIIALGGLTRLGQRPTPLARLALVLDRSVAATIALVR